MHKSPLSSNSSTILLPLTLSILLSAMGTAFAADEDLQKEGVVNSSPTAEDLSSKLGWTVTHSNNLDTLMENVSLTDMMSGGQTLSPGSLLLPEGWSAQFSNDGGTNFSPIEPASGVNAIIFTNPLVVPTDLGKGRTLTLPVSKTVYFSGGGDGYNPALLDNGRIMGINHHSPSPNLWCYDTRTEAICEGYPKKPGIPTGHTPVGIAIGNKLYLGDDSGGNQAYGQRGKIYCWNSDSDRTCGQSRTVPGGGYAGPVLSRKKLYVLTSTGLVDCYDPSKGLDRCKDFTPLNISTLPGNTLAWFTTGTDMQAWGNRIFIATQAGKLTCFDTLTDTLCNDWASNPITIPAPGNRFDLFRRMDTDGKVDGICAGGLNMNATCYNLDGSSPETVATASVATQSSGMAWAEGYFGTRVFFSAAWPNQYIGCWDWATRSACTGIGFSAGKMGPAAMPYALSSDGSCIYSFGDGGTLYSWNPLSGEQNCHNTAGRISVNMDEYFCKTPAEPTARWDKVKFYDVNLAAGVEFSSLLVKVINPATGEIVKGPVEMVGGTGELDLSDIPPTIRVLEINPIGKPVGKVAWNDGIAPKVALTFRSVNPARFCYATEVACSPYGGGNGVVSTRSMRSSQLVSNTISTNITPGVSASGSIPVCNSAPVIRTPANLNFASLAVQAVVDILSTDDSSSESSSGGGITYSISGGDDASLFSVDVVGVLSFNTPPDTNSPTDANGDNVYHVEVSVTDTDGLTSKRLFNISVRPDQDGDSIIDLHDLDIDGDGISNLKEGGPTRDTDGDGVPDERDLDSDNDGILDSWEAQAGLTYLAPSGVDANQDGVDDAYGSSILPVDTDGDSIPNPYDADDDSDSILTQFESPDANGDGIPTDARDTDQDGIPDYLDADDDGDGTPTQGELPTGAVVDGVPANASDKDGDGTPDYLDAEDLSILSLQVRGLLQGAYDVGSGLMREDLNIHGVLPLEHPFGDPVTSLGYPGEETLSLSLLGMVGADAPVDWVLVELRAANDPIQRVYATAGILQRDGDVADPQTNANTLKFKNLPAGNYYVTLRHRNHLGVMTLNPVALSPTLRVVDFTRLDIAVSGTHARTSVGSVALLWAGDTNNSDSVIAAGPGNDDNPLLETLLLNPANTVGNTNFSLVGYYPSDVNLDSQTIYSGPGNDKNLIISNVLLHPGNTNFATNYVVEGSMPK